MTTGLSAAEQYLAASDPDWASLIARVGPCRLQARAAREPYEALVRAIAYQQLHGKAAEAILRRFLALYPGTAFPEPSQVLATDPQAIKACGFSSAKILSIQGIAQAALDGIVPSRKAADTMSDQTLVEQLTTLRGVGRWTVEMLLIFGLERPDVLPVDDFGVREGWRIMKNLSAQPKPKALALAGENWRPYRSTAAWYLWQASVINKPAITPAGNAPA
jgi:DNA-3-methyladenine glycosylase II